MSGSRRATRIVVACVSACLAALAGCGEPATLPWPSARELQLFMLVDPDAASQPILVQSVYGGGRGNDILSDASVSVWRDGAEIASGAAVNPKPTDEYNPCHERYGGLIGLQTRCIELAFTPTPGTYEIRASSTDRPMATATTTVPGPFAIVSRSIDGSPPGTVRIEAIWTSSPGAHRYVVAIGGVQSHPNYRCSPDAGCFKRWFVSTIDTTIAAVVDASYFENAGGPWRLDIYAMNEDAYGYLMTAGNSELFPVPPRQNVVGGYGAVGAWVRRSVPLM